MVIQRAAAALALTLCLTGCPSGVTEGGPDGGKLAFDAGPITANGAAINTYLASTSAFAVEPLQKKVGSASAAAVAGDYSCSTQSVDEARQYDRVVAYASGSDVIWPGSLLKGDSIDTGQLTPIVFDRKPLIISASLESLTGTHSAQLDSPSLSSYRNAIGSILAGGVSGATPANLSSEIEQVRSEQQLNLALGAKTSWAGLGNVSGSFHFNDESIRSRFVVRYVQSYYTVDADSPRAPSDFFAGGVTVDELKQKMGAGDPPVYVASVTYGRMVVFTFESSYSFEEMGAALEFSFKGGAQAGGSVSATHQEKITSSKISAYILGGSGGEAAGAIGSYEDLMTFIRKGGNYSKESPGAPIAYKLRYLKDSSPRLMSLVQSYSVTTCERINQKVKVTLENFTVDNANGAASLDIYGEVTVGPPSAFSYLFKRTSSEAATMGLGQKYPSSGVVRTVEVNVVPKAGQNIPVDFNLMRKDLVFDDHFGDVISNHPVFSFEEGWRRSLPVSLSNGALQITAHLTFKPL